jgi:hypothetical protein
VIVTNALTMRTPILLLIAIAILHLLVGAVETFWLSPGLVDMSGAEPAYYTDYAPLWGALPVSVIALILAYLLYQRSRFGYWASVLITALYVLMGTITFITVPDLFSLKPLFALLGAVEMVLAYLVAVLLLVRRRRLSSL